MQKSKGSRVYGVDLILQLVGGVSLLAVSIMVWQYDSFLFEMPSWLVTKEVNRGLQSIIYVGLGIWLLFDVALKWLSSRKEGL